MKKLSKKFWLNTIAFGGIGFVFDWLSSLLIKELLVWQHFSVHITGENRDSYIALFSILCSVAFIATSVLTVLSEKDRYIYWVDIIKESLIKPPFLNFHSYCMYAFASLVVSCYGFFRRRSALVLGAFFIGMTSIFLLTMKMIGIYYGEASKKDKIQKGLVKRLKETEQPEIVSIKIRKEMDQLESQIYRYCREYNFDEAFNCLDLFLKTALADNLSDSIASFFIIRYKLILTDISKNYAIETIKYLVSPLESEMKEQQDIYEKLKDASDEDGEEKGKEYQSKQKIWQNIRKIKLTTFCEVLKNPKFAEYNERLDIYLCQWIDAGNEFSDELMDRFIQFPVKKFDVDGYDRSPMRVINRADFLIRLLHYTSKNKTDAHEEYLKSKDFVNELHSIFENYRAEIDKLVNNKNTLDDDNLLRKRISDAINIAYLYICKYLMEEKKYDEDLVDKNSPGLQESFSLVFLPLMIKDIKTLKKAKDDADRFGAELCFSAVIMQIYAKSSDPISGMLMECVIKELENAYEEVEVENKKNKNNESITKRDYEVYFEFVIDQACRNVKCALCGEKGGELCRNEIDILSYSNFRGLYEPIQSFDNEVIGKYTELIFEKYKISGNLKDDESKTLIMDFVDSYMGEFCEIRDWDEDYRPSKLDDYRKALDEEAKCGEFRDDSIHFLTNKLSKENLDKRSIRNELVKYAITNAEYIKTKKKLISEYIILEHADRQKPLEEYKREIEEDYEYMQSSLSDLDIPSDEIVFPWEAD